MCSTWNSAIPVLIDSLINRGANINCQNKEEYTPLHIAILKGEGRDDLHIIKKLIQLGADINIKDKDNRTPLDYLESSDRDKLMIYLQKMKSKIGYFKPILSGNIADEKSVVKNEKEKKTHLRRDSF